MKIIYHWVFIEFEMDLMVLFLLLFLTDTWQIRVIHLIFSIHTHLTLWSCEPRQTCAGEIVDMVMAKSAITTWFWSTFVYIYSNGNVFYRGFEWKSRQDARGMHYCNILHNSDITIGQHNLTNRRMHTCCTCCTSVTRNARTHKTISKCFRASTMVLTR